LQLRLRNYAETDPHRDLPFSSKALKQCYAAGAEAFGWARRPPEPRAMRDGPVLIGRGLATAAYPANRSEAGARVVFARDRPVAAAGELELADGFVRLGSAPHRQIGVSALLARHRLDRLRVDGSAKPGDEKKQYSMHAFGAQFAEVRVDPELGEVRVSRFVG